MTLEVGWIGKAHGLHGEVNVRLTTDRTDERTAKGAILFAVLTDGKERTLEVAKAKPYQKGYLVHFVGVAGRPQAEALRGAVLSAEVLHDDDEVFVHELIGKTLIDQHSTSHGVVQSVIDNPASELLELSNDRLVPAVFIAEVGEDQVMVDIPDGLFEVAVSDTAVSDTAVSDTAVRDTGSSDAAD